MKQILYYLILGTRGGYARARIIDSVKRKPKNAHQLAKSLKYDYKTVQHHLDILLKNRLLDKQGKYGGIYFISSFMKENMSEFNKIWVKFG